ncbi:MAG: UvrD-helicase domain-containing protein [Acidimicrobiales bacterium]
MSQDPEQHHPGQQHPEQRHPEQLGFEGTGFGTGGAFVTGTDAGPAGAGTGTESADPEDLDLDQAPPEDLDQIPDDAPPRPARAAKAVGPSEHRQQKKRPEWLLDQAGLDALLVGLNEPQREAVVYKDGPLLVVAGAGSGKTRVLTRRIAYLVGSGEVAPWGVLAITFTNKAAEEMRSRVRELLGEAADKMWVSTFHSACVRILRSQADRLGYRRSFTIYDDADSRRLVEQVERDLGLDTKRLPPRSVQGAISAAKSELLDFEAYRASAQTFIERRVADVYTEYQQRLHAASAMDFDDLLLVTVNLFDAFPDVLAAYRQRFRQVLVDEFQDTNRAQNELVLRLTSEHRNVTVVGDVDQSIYAWRGADIRNLLEFKNAFPDAKTVALEQNYRSTKTILDVANAVIVNNVSRVPKDLWTDVGAGDLVCRYRAEDERDEALWVASEIGRLHSAETLPYGDVAVFYRTNAQSRVLEEELVREGVPYKVVGGTRFYDRREVRDVLAYLKVLLNPSDEISCRRIVNVPKRGVGDTSVDRMASWARSHNRSFADAFFEPEEAGLTGKAAKGVKALAELLEELRQMVTSDASPASIVDAVLERTGYSASLRADSTVESEGRLENLAELQTVAAEYNSLDSFLESVALVSDSDELEGDGTRVSLMTLHVAKGLEFPAVFLVGMEDGIFPHSRSIDDPAGIEEERRLFYVGITRARRFLYLSHAWSRTVFGSTSAAIASRFLKEVPEELVRDSGLSYVTRPDPARLPGDRSGRGGSGRWSTGSGSGSRPGSDRYSARGRDDWDELDSQDPFEAQDGYERDRYDSESRYEREDTYESNGGYGRTRSGGSRSAASGFKQSPSTRSTSTASRSVAARSGTAGSAATGSGATGSGATGSDATGSGPAGSGYRYDTVPTRSTSSTGARSQSRAAGSGSSSTSTSRKPKGRLPKMAEDKFK